MHVTDRSKTVVMLIDWDNLQICHSRDAPGTELDLQALIALAQSYGTLVSARAYAEWNLLSERLAVYKAGIEPVFAPVMRPEGSPREGKSLADTVMVADGVDLLWTVAPDVFVLATSDKDMIPLARIAKQRGAAVVVLGSDLTAIPLVEMSNVFITYRQLLRELDRVSELEAPVGRAPARERRLRESRRPNTEPYTGGLGSGAIGVGPIGSGGRTSSRAVGMGASAPPAPPLPAIRVPRRRFDEPVAPAPMPEPERALPAPVAPASFPTEAADDDGSLGGGDLGPRRRRRRGGRGRRTGLGGVGEGDIQAEVLQDALDDSDEGDGTEVDRGGTVTAAANPDDIENAVLQLLASRDREISSAVVQDESPAETAVAPDLSTPVPIPSEQPSSAAPRRAVRTSFSSFGPPDSLVRPASDAPVQEWTEADPTADSTRVPEREEESEASASTALPEFDSVTQGLVPDAVVTEAVHAEPVADAAFPQLAPVSADETETVPPAEPDVADLAAADSERPGRSGRTSRSSGTRRTRRPAGRTSETNGTIGIASSADEAASPDEASDGGEAAQRAPRRRRVRRPMASPSGAAVEAVTSEAGEAVTTEAGA